MSDDLRDLEDDIAALLEEETSKGEGAPNAARLRPIDIAREHLLERARPLSNPP